MVVDQHGQSFYSGASNAPAQNLEGILMSFNKGQISTEEKQELIFRVV